MTMQLHIDGNRAVLTGKLDKRVLRLKSFEGRKVWLKAGGYSFEPTPFNLEQFADIFPDVKIEDARPSDESLFAALPAGSFDRGSYAPKTKPFPFQDHCLAAAGHPVSPRPVGLHAAPPPPNRGLEGLIQTQALDHEKPPLELAESPIIFNSLQEANSQKPHVFKAKLAEGVPAPAFAVFAETGTGKTKILIDMAGTLWCAGLIDAVLIISPKGVHEQWVKEQLPEHLGLPYHAQAISQKDKIKEWTPDKLAILSVNIDYVRLENGLKNCFAFIDGFKKRVLLILDESHKIKNYSSNRTETIQALGRACAFRRIATGTPIAKNLVDAFAQYYFLDKRILGQEYITTFKASYCVMGGFELSEVVDHKNVEQFYGRIAPYTFRITKEEADLQLPPKHYARHSFELSEEQRKHYVAMKRDMITQMDNGKLATVANAVAQLTRLQQIGCGFLVSGADKEKGIPGEIQPLKNARLEALQEVLESREGKCVVWARFDYDILAIREALGRECVTYYGATSPDARTNAKQRFLDPHSGIRFFVGNPAAGGTGLNLQGDCRTVVYYSNSFNAIDRWQSEDRVHRIGTKGAVTYIDLVATRSVDTKILNNLRDKKSISDLTFDEIRRLLAEE